MRASLRLDEIPEEMLASEDPTGGTDCQCAAPPRHPGNPKQTLNRTLNKTLNKP